MATPIRHLRWYIGGLLFLSTVINYIDRQTLSVLAPYIKTEFQWTNPISRWLIVAFRIAYAFGQTASGRLLDKIGTRNGLTIAVAFYSIAAMLTSLATGFKSLAVFRFLLGAGESANWPGATKAVSEWFPRRDSGWAVALFDSGSSIGGALAPFIVLWTYHTFGSWRPAFIVTGVLGFLWLILFRMMYRRPEDHPRLSAEERALILEGRASATTGTESRLSYGTLLRLPQTWGIIIGKSLTDPVWFFITDWFAIYLVSKGYRLEESLLAFWVPFLAADLGNFAGGGVSSYLIKRGWGVGSAQAGGARVWPRHDAPDPDGVHDVVRHARHLLRDLDVRLRRVFDDGVESAGGFVSERIGGLGQRHERHWRRHRHHRGDAVDRAGRRSLVVRTDLGRRESDSAARDRGGARARA